MQQQMWELWRATARDDDTPEYPGDFNLYYDLNYIAERAAITKASNYAVWPAAGGYDDQDPLLVADFQTHWRGERWARWEKDHPAEAARIVWEWQRKQYKEAESPAEHPNTARTLRDLVEW